MQGPGRDLEAARAVLAELINDNPDHALARFMRGRIHMTVGRYDAAREDLQAAKQLDPDGFDYRHRIALATLFDALGDTSLAISEYEQILEEQPNNPRVVTMLVDLYLKHNQRGEAQDLLGRYAAMQPNDPFWPAQLARMSLEEQRYEAAARYAERAYELTDRQSAAYLFDWLRALVLGDRFTQALNVYEDLPPDQRRPMVRLAAARALRETGQPDEARSQIATALVQAAGQNVEAVSQVATQARQIVGDEDMLAVFASLFENPPEEVAGNVPRTVRLRIGYAERLSLAGRPAEAVAMADAALEVIPEEFRDSNERKTALIAKATALESDDGDFAVVRDLYEEALRIENSNLMVLNNLAFLLAKNDSPSEALPYAERLRRMDVSNPSVWDTIGVVMMMNERYEEAQEAFRQALTLNQSFLDANYHMAELLLERQPNRDYAVGRQFAQKTIEIAEGWLNRNTTASADRRAEVQEWISKARALLQQAS
jgi:tetratricopeptide (TPR) repeat protein